MKAFLTYTLTLLVALLCLDAHSQVSTAPTGPVTYLQTDLTGNVVLATDAAGNTAWDERYLPYGAKRLGAAGGTGGVDSSTQKYGFQDKALDPETGLQYVGARYYDPLSGRFSGMDPAASPNATIYTFNRYGFANNNPYRYGDRDGRNPVVEYTLVYAAATALGAAVLGEWIGGQFFNALHSEGGSNKPPVPPSMAGAAISTPAGPGQDPNSGQDGNNQRRGFASQRLRDSHFQDHGSDFGAKTAQEYEQQADRFLNGPRDQWTLQGVRANGDIVRYNDVTQEFGVVKPDGTIRTYYHPDPAIHEYPSNLDYFYAQFPK
jgi:RHS repeat-associated protein